MTSSARLAIAESSNRAFEDFSVKARTAAVNMFESLGSWRDRDIDRLLERFIPFANQAVSTAASREAAFQARSLAVGTGVMRSPVVITPAMAGSMIEDPGTYWRYPASAMYTALARGSAMGYAIERGSSLLSEQLRRALTQGRYRAIEESVGRSGLTRFARVLGASACTYCARIIGAGTARYHIENLQPLHKSCNCGVIGEAEQRDL